MRPIWIVKIALNRPHTFIVLALLILIMSPVGILRTPQDSSGQRSPTDRQPLFRSAANWFTWPSRFWAVGPSFSETLFDAGRRRATKETAVAAYDGSVANYRRTTLTAFQQVVDNLAVLRILAGESQQQRDASAAAEEIHLFMNRYAGGVDTYLQVVTSQTTALSNERNDIDIRRRQLDASVLLIKTLGGDWNVNKLPKV